MSLRNYCSCNSGSGATLIVVFRSVDTTPRHNLHFKNLHELKIFTVKRQNRAIKSTTYVATAFEHT